MFLQIGSPKSFGGYIVEFSCNDHERVKKIHETYFLDRRVSLRLEQNKDEDQESIEALAPLISHTASPHWRLSSFHSPDQLRCCLS